MMHNFKEFLDAIDTPGGHIMIGVCLGLLGVVVAMRGHTEVAKGLLEFLLLVAYAMRGTTKANGQGKPQ